ncbi:hypothetical protein X777_15430, partial [Ooceraea biroi]
SVVGIPRCSPSAGILPLESFQSIGPRECSRGPIVSRGQRAASRHAICTRGTRSDTSCLSSGSRRQGSKRERTREGNRKEWVTEPQPRGERTDTSKRHREKSGPLWSDAEIMLTGPLRTESRFPEID